jgi:c-di-GMP-binding flagellar brake protein YcgR
MTNLAKTSPGLVAGHVIKRTPTGTTTRVQTAEERRRAQRVMLRVSIDVHVAGKTDGIRATTVTVSENGGMLVMTDGLPMGAKVTLTNPRTQKTVEAHVVRAGQSSADGMQVPVEFNSPSPNFWGVFFPPSAN